MNEQEILDNAPEGATSYSAKQKQYWDWPKRTVKPFDSGHLDIDYPDDLRTIADLQTIVEQQKRIVELELFLDRILEIEHSRGGSLDVSGQFMYKTPESIFKQAKQLREGG